LLRYETIVQWQTRTVLEDVELAGVPISAGSVVAVMMGAANRDPLRWDDPDTYDIRRAPKTHLGFGFGMHACLGLNLARLELELYLDRLLTELPNWHVAEPVDYGLSFPVRGPTRVMVGAE
jgi:cytochrome P450